MVLRAFPALADSEAGFNWAAPRFDFALSFRVPEGALFTGAHRFLDASTLVLIFLNLLRLKPPSSSLPNAFTADIPARTAAPMAASGS